MKSTADFLDALRVKLNLPSDGQLADYLGMHRQHMSRYRTLAGTFDDERSIQIADLLEIDPVFVVACMHAQRAKRTEEKSLWERIATLSAGVTVALLAVFALPFTSADDMQYGLIALSAAPSSGSLYIMSNDGNKRKGSQEYCEPFAFWWAVLGSNQ